MDKRSYLGKILIVVFVAVPFTLFTVYTVDTGDLSGLMMDLFLIIAIFFILNSQRYIKYGKWYIDPTSFGWPSNEAILLFHAWASLLFGIMVFILMIWLVISAVT